MRVCRHAALVAALVALASSASGAKGREDQVPRGLIRVAKQLRGGDFEGKSVRNYGEYNALITAALRVADPKAQQLLGRMGRLHHRLDEVPRTIIEADPGEALGARTWGEVTVERDAKGHATGMVRIAF